MYRYLFFFISVLFLVSSPISAQAEELEDLLVLEELILQESSARDTLYNCCCIYPKELPSGIWVFIFGPSFESLVDLSGKDCVENGTIGAYSCSPEPEE